MAKFVGFVGTIRGKIGTTVFTKGEKGLSYGRSYQPQVYNPKTAGQVDQRAKMNLVGRMSQVTPKALLVGLGVGSNRQRRSAFNKMLLNAATVDRSDITNIVAKIAPEDIIFSDGMVPIAASAAAPVVSAGAVSIILTLDDAALAGIYGERIVVAVIDPDNKGGYSVVKFVDKVLDNTSAATVSVSFPVVIKAQSLVCVYRIPFELSESGTSYRTSSLNNDGVDVIASMMSSREFVRDFGLSVLHSSSVFTAA
jgi:hypothetical protein